MTKKSSLRILIPLGVACICISFVLVWISVDGRNHSKNQPVVMNIAGAEIDESRFSLGSFNRLAGREILIAPLQSKRSSGGGFSSSPYYTTCNFLFCELPKSKAFWLLPDQSSVIKWHAVANFGEPKSPSETASAVLFHIVDRRTNDDRPDSIPGYIAITRPDGGEFTKLADGVDQVLDFDTRNLERKHLVYVSGATLRAMEIDLANLSVISDSDLSVSVNLEDDTADQ